MDEIEVTGYPILMILNDAEMEFIQSSLAAGRRVCEGKARRVGHDEDDLILAEAAKNTFAKFMYGRQTYEDIIHARSTSTT